MAKQFSYELFIQEHHLDTFGHVNNAEYLKLYEEARWDFITNNGFGLTEIMKLSQGPVILEVTMRFKREIPNRTPILIESVVQESKGKIMKIQQKMKNKSEEIIYNEALFTVGYMDFKLRKLVTPPLQWMKAAGVLEN